MKRDNTTSQAVSVLAGFSCTLFAHSLRTRSAMAVGLTSACMAMGSSLAWAGQSSPAASNTPAGIQPTAERHVELRKVLSAPQDVGAGRDNRRKMSPAERNVLRESMRGVYEGGEPGAERSYKTRP